MNSAREFSAGDYDLVPNVRNDVVVRGSDVQVVQVDRISDRWFRSTSINEWSWTLRLHRWLSEFSKNLSYDSNQKWLHHDCLVLEGIFRAIPFAMTLTWFFHPRREPIHIQRRSRCARLTGRRGDILDFCALCNESPVRELQIADIENYW